MPTFSRVSIAFVACLENCVAIQIPVKNLDPSVVVGGACSSDSECPLSTERSKCCPVDGTFTYGCKPGVTYHDMPAANCSAPGGANARPIQCTCVVPEPCLWEGGEPFARWPYEAAKPGMKQWLIVGDSISWGLLRPAKEHAEKLGIQLEHTPTNAKNVWWGAKCMSQWFGADSKRWDAISFNFGLHDLSMSLERVEPKLYSEMLVKFAYIVHTEAPRAALVWATTTPAPDGSERTCNSDLFFDGSTTWGGCPPREPTEVLVYNKVAAEAFAATSLKITTADLYSTVVAKCGKRFTSCKGFQKPMEVHFDEEGNEALGKAYADSVAAVI